jgi:hypothetical protein
MKKPKWFTLKEPGKKKGLLTVTAKAKRTVRRLKKHKLQL